MVIVMAVRPSRPALRERFDRRQDELIADAARVFARSGYDQTTMQELAAALGVATGALYHYFSAKEELLRAICDQVMEPLLQTARGLAAAPTSPEERLRELVGEWVAHVCTHRDHMLVFQQERHLIETGADWRAVRASRKAFERLIAGVLEEIDPAGLRTEPELALRALLSMVNYTPSWYRPRGALSPEQIADGYLALVLAG
jgi:TetR/AcrR family transcriptional regulator, cholesterol catabolism regulator